MTNLLISIQLFNMLLYTLCVLYIVYKFGLCTHRLWTTSTANHNNAPNSVGKRFPFFLVLFGRVSHHSMNRSNIVVEKLTKTTFQMERVHKSIYVKYTNGVYKDFTFLWLSSIEKNYLPILLNSILFQYYNIDTISNTY